MKERRKKVGASTKSCHFRGMITLNIAAKHHRCLLSNKEEEYTYFQENKQTNKRTTQILCVLI